jgi:hypothetical protein
MKTKQSGEPTKLIIINKTYLENNKERFGQRTVYVCKYGVSISKCTRETLHLTAGDRVNFAMDAKNIKKLYLFKARPDDDDAFEIKPFLNGSIRIQKKKLSLKLLSTFKMNKIQFMISINPEIINGYKCHQMIQVDIPEAPRKKNKNTRKNKKYEL